MKTVHTLGLLFLTLTFALSCGVSDSKSASNLPLLRQNKAVEDLYGPLVGTYDCDLTNTNHGKDEKGKLIIMISSAEATNPDGTPGTRKVPAAIFQRISPVVADYNLKPSGYRRETGDISMTGTKDNLTYTILGKIENQILTGIVQLSDGGKLADLSCKWKTRNTGIGDTQNDRLLEAYRAIAGLYIGTVVSQVPGKKSWPVTFSINVEDSDGKPRLYGYFQRNDVDRYLDLVLTVNYRPELDPPEITMSGQKPGTPYELHVRGSIKDAVMDVAVGTQLGPFGVFKAKREELPKPDDHSEDYEKVAGTYQGSARFTRSNGKRGPTVQFTLKLTADQVNGLPSLNAQLTRSDKAQAGGKIAAAGFDPTVSKTDLQVSTDAGDGELNNIKGKFGTKKLTVSISTPTDGKIKSVVLKKLDE